VHMAAGPQAYLLATFSIKGLMRDVDGEKNSAEVMIADGLLVNVDATLEEAMPLFSKSDTGFIPVVSTGDITLLGVLYEVDALRAFNQALVETAREEHS